MPTPQGGECQFLAPVSGKWIVPVEIPRDLGVLCQTLDCGSVKEFSGAKPQPTQSSFHGEVHFENGELARTAFLDRGVNIT